MSLRLIFRLFLVICLITINSAQRNTSSVRALEKRILDSIIGPGRYDSRIRPTAINDTQNGPAVVNVDMFVRSFSKMDDRKMEYSCQLTFRELWNDERLVFDDSNGKIKYLTLTDPERIWKPDLFFSNEKEGRFHNIFMPNVLTRIYPIGDVLYSIRISLVLSCPMDLTYFPLDRQTCSIIMASYGYSAENLVFLWKKNDPVQISRNHNLQRFSLERFFTDYCTSRTSTGEYTCLKVDFVFKRDFNYYLIQIYIPCCLLIFVSWISFWLDPRAVSVRVSLGVTLLFLMTMQISQINASLPPVSYIRAIDVWTGVCMTFVFGALLEFTLVNYASRNEDHGKQPKQRRYAQRRRSATLELEADKQDDVIKNSGIKPLVTAADLNNDIEMKECKDHIPERFQKRSVFFQLESWWLKRYSTRSKRIDAVSRIFFPLVFAFFNLWYWMTYLPTEKY